ncbi:uncharacterized protein FOMMEDRAFT_161009 [Fomitiporia mediterranea MF3/22]|uniref:uncharacterized protein n=1 Tax=Fomitiporia mediterranea (strain MF3/22) TaxID=694068 RepID=UPI00044090E4|nr:uncharacterized protein FOMMEDRAFT_161009 [Fomitiporia mediterranea MF3/22]EJC98834.1 hypothetical protein FOMMEDRAFT_161009 [Fomitiporia mediterranea MF3/22]
MNNAECTPRSNNRGRRANAAFQSRTRGRGRGRGRGTPVPEAHEIGNSVGHRQAYPNAVKGETKLDFVPSISRSGGDSGQGDTLKDKAVQQKYWAMIQEKLAAHWDEFPSRSDRTQLQIEKESNILLLLRKLREGVLASQRTDEFALEVYELSFYLAIIFESVVQASSSLSHLPELYCALRPESASASQVSSISNGAEALAVVSLIFHLCEAYPSQLTYYRQERLLARFLLQKGSNSDALKWTLSVRASINCKNFTKFEHLTRQSRLNSLIENIAYLSGQEAREKRHLVQTALCSVVERLRRKLRAAVWTILRSAYREFTIGTETDTSTWLLRSLCLESVGDGRNENIEEWMERNSKDGLVVKKEGFRGRWMLKR